MREAGKQFSEPAPPPENPRGLVVRIFNNPVTKYNLAAEHAYCTTLSKQGLAPRCYFQNDEYRIDQLLEVRNSSLWEMRNPCFMRRAVRKICDLHNNLELEQRLLEAVGSRRPLFEWEDFCARWVAPYRRIHDLVLSGDRAYPDVYVRAVKAYEFVLAPSFQDQFERLIP